MTVEASRDALNASIRERECDALTRLTAATGGQSLCASSGGIGGAPSVKYYEGMVAACAEARRGLARLTASLAPESRPEVDQGYQALRDLRDRWVAQSGTPGRSGQRWADYLSGGLAAFDRLLAD